MSALLVLGVTVWALALGANVAVLVVAVAHIARGARAQP